jgi:hypothetical protein
LSERDDALQIAKHWLDFEFGMDDQAVGDPDCPAVILARQYIRERERADNLLLALDIVTNTVKRMNGRAEL